MMIAKSHEKVIEVKDNAGNTIYRGPEQRMNGNSGGGVKIPWVIFAFVVMILFGALQSATGYVIRQNDKRDDAQQAIIDSNTAMTLSNTNRLAISETNITEIIKQMDKMQTKMDKTLEIVTEIKVQQKKGYTLHE